MPTILITGINGFLGSHLANDLKNKFEVIGLTRSFENLFRVKTHDFKIYSYKENELEEIFKENKIFAVLHVATVYRSSKESISPLLETNVILPANLMKLSVKYKVKAFINTDSFFNNQKYNYSYLPEYTLSKKQSLDWIKMLASSNNCKVVNMKIFHMYGENDSSKKFIPYILGKIRNNSEYLDLTEGEQTRDFIYVRDVVKAYKVVLDNIEKLDGFKEFELGTGFDYSIKTIAKLIKEISGSTTTLNFGKIPYREGEIMESKADNSSLRALGWKPDFSLKKGFESYIS